MDAELSSERLKLLQDLCSSSGHFPDSYWIDGVTKGRRISAGGEATVYMARRRDHAVVVREFHPIDGEEWNEPEAQSVKKVSLFDSFV
jgi:hypothetical protein